MAQSDDACYMAQSCDESEGVEFRQMNSIKTVEDAPEVEEATPALVLDLNIKACNDAHDQRRHSSVEDGPRQFDELPPSYWRWVVLTVLCVDICVSYLPYYSFVPIWTQAMRAYGTTEGPLNWLCIVYALVYIPGAFLTGPIVSAVGTRWTFVLAMSLTTVGCAVRRGLDSVPIRHTMVPDPALANFTEIGPLDVGPSDWGTHLDFNWLLIGQTIAALGQPLIVNLTSEMAAEWFPPHERPLAAMVTNLMNFIGSSLSFMLPPMIVQEQSGLYGPAADARAQILNLLRVHFALAALSLALTLTLYRKPPSCPGFINPHREQMPFLAEVSLILQTRDFWLVCMQFAIFIAIGHAFDATEGQILVEGGFKASLSSWTSVSCCIGGIASTVLESGLIHSATAYRPALMLSHTFNAVSLLLCFATLHWHTDRSVFVIGVGVMGLATPAWGCSCELGSEVCYPAREATISSLLEAFSNLLGAASIIGAQWVLDKGYGHWVLVMMGGAASFAGVTLCGLRGRLLRHEAEAAEGEDDLSPKGNSGPSVGLPFLSPTSLTRRLSREISVKISSRFRERRRKPLVVLRSACFTLLILGLLAALRLHFRPRIRRHPPHLPLLLHNGSAPHGMETENYLIVCPYGKTAEHDEQQRVKRFMKFAHDAGLVVKQVDCMDAATPEVVITQAVQDGYLPSSAAEAVLEPTWSGGKAKLWALLRAVAHMRVMREISASQHKCRANVFETEEVVWREDFVLQRDSLLQELPKALHMVKLNVGHAAGRPWPGPLGMYVYMLVQGLSKAFNRGMANYVITPQGAQMALEVGRQYDGSGIAKSFDQYLLDGLVQRQNFRGFSVQSSVLGIYCQAEDEGTEEHCSLDNLEQPPATSSMVIAQ